MNYKKYETYRSLRALSIGDASGENEMKVLPQAAYKAGNVAIERGVSIEIANHWPWTDDTHMAIGVTRVLFKFNGIDQKALADEFANNYYKDRMRGYGNGTGRLLQLFLYDSENWKSHSSTWWQTPNGFSGSIGNGSAMRDTVIGAHFGLDFDAVTASARASAEVTHYSDPAIAGSIAVALAAAIATYGNLDDYWSTILRFTPSGELRDRIEWVSQQDAQHTSNWDVVTKVGNGKNVLVLDTVPFALWQAYQMLLWNRPFAEGINSIIEVGGDTDTLGAIYGGIIGNRIFPTKEEDLRTEPLPEDLVAE